MSSEMIRTDRAYFRAKDSRTGEWRYGWYVGYSQAEGYIHRDYIDNHEVWGVDATTLGQWTGVWDKDGRGVFEGDILKGTATFECGGFDYLGAVTYLEQADLLGYWIADEQGAWDIRDVRARVAVSHLTGKVIGNVYDNPELLEVKDNGNASFDIPG